MLRKEAIRYMKPVRIIIRSIRDSFKNIIRNFSLSLAAILCATITLMLVSVSMIFGANVNQITEKVESELNIVVYMTKVTCKKDNSSCNVEEEEEKIRTNFESELEKLDLIDSYTLKTKEEWKEEMSKYNNSYKEMFEYLGEDNPLVDSYTIKVKDAKSLTDVAKFINSINGVHQTKYGEGMVEGIISAFDIIKIVSFGIVVALVLVTAFLISNTIKLTIFSRRSEIEIMRLVGASNASIKMPFLFEGFLLGFLGSIIPIFVTIYGYIVLYFKLDGKIVSEMVGLINPFNFIFAVSACLLIIGTVVGMFGSIRAVRKYLKI
jgi:cell division transport system permease protein